MGWAWPMPGGCTWASRPLESHWPTAIDGSRISTRWSLVRSTGSWTATARRHSPCPSILTVPARSRGRRCRGAAAPSTCALPTGLGGAVSLIESNYAGFGSGLVDPETGIAYQNRGAFFRLDPSHANSLAPRKRTLHTLTPGMLMRDGEPWVVHGSMGGEIQPQVFAQMVSAIVDGGVDVATAVGAPRWAADVPGHLRPPSLTLLESRYRDEVVAGLRARGHDPRVIEPWSSAMGHAHAIEIVREGDDAGPTFAAATDPRSEGLPGAW